MATKITVPPTIYEPEWNPETETYEDMCPFEKGSRGQSYKCKCRHEEGDTINTWSQFQAHFKRDYHVNWRQRFHQVSTYDVVKLQKENEELKKENVMMSIRFDRDLAQSKRDFIKLKMDFATYKNKIKRDIFYECPIDE